MVDKFWVKTYMGASTATVIIVIYLLFSYFVLPS